jgi:MoxR-like ATPase
MDDPSSVDALVGRVRDLYSRVRAGLVERDDALYLALVAMVTGEHLLLVGPPGTAKSEVARRLRLVLREGRWFERLLTRFTVPEEIFGPLSIKGLQNDVYERLGEGYLPTADVAFLDEVFRGNSAILNALLGILNEREIDNGARRIKVPLACLVAACNAIPDDEDLAALSDRFVLRHDLRPVSGGSFAAMLDASPAADPPEEMRLAPHDLDALRRAALRVELPSWTVDLLRTTRAALEKRGMYVSDRRWKKAAAVLRASALLGGRSWVTVADVALLPACLWQRVEQRSAIEDIVRAQLDEIFDDEPRRYEAIIVTLEKTVADDLVTTRQKVDAGGPVFVDPEGYRTNRATTRRHKKNIHGELLFKRPTQIVAAPRYAWTLEELKAEIFPVVADLRRYVSDRESWIMEDHPHEPLVEKPTLPREHVERRIEQIERLASNMHAFREAVAAAHGEKGWAPRAGRTVVSGAAATSLERLDALAERLRTTRALYGSIPTHDALTPVRVAS